MNKFALATLALCLPASALYAIPVCSNGTLTSYVNAPNLICPDGNVSIGFNQPNINNVILPTYVGLNLLSSNNSAATTDSINVTLNTGTSGITFSSSAFKVNPAVLPASQAELVQFMVYSAGTALTSTTFSLGSPAVSGGLADIVIGQELICVGGTFTSLPLGLVTTVANGVLGTGNFGCSGAVLVGTAANSTGVLSNITSLLGLPNLTGLTDTATIQVGTPNTTQLDVIKLQALISVPLVGVSAGNAQDASFGDTFQTGPLAAPEPTSVALMFGGLAVIGYVKRRRRPA